MLLATDGNLYGTTQYSSPGYGAIFKITPDGTLTTIHSFDWVDGENPKGLVQATDGNLYGTAAWGGGGTVWDAMRSSPNAKTPKLRVLNPSRPSPSRATPPEPYDDFVLSRSSARTRQPGGLSNSGTAFETSYQAVARNVFLNARGRLPVDQSPSLFTPQTARAPEQ
jgi:uncharacterized repeat protein (TIGR03803 family)